MAEQFLCVCDADIPRLERPECYFHEDCDELCKAPRNPETIDEYKAALEHWRSHGYLSGCAHGC